MSLLTVQSLLARLYTDSAFCARFFAEPGEACREMGLTEPERQSLVGLDRAQVERFARSLRQKRLGLVRELLPAAAGVLGDRFGELFFRYCDCQPSALERVEEAKAFVGYLLPVLAEQVAEIGEAPACMPECGRQSAAGRGSETRGHAKADWRPSTRSAGTRGKVSAVDPVPSAQATTPDLPLPAYFADLLACERLRLDVLFAMGSDEPRTPSIAPICAGGSLANRPDAYPRLTESARVSRFRYDMEMLYPGIVEGEPVEARLDPCFILIGKVRGTMRVRLKRVNPATARLLVLCDGTRAFAAIVEEVAAGLGLSPAERDRLEVEAIRLLEPLVASKLVVLEPGTR